MADNRSYVYGRLRRELGLTPAQAAGVIGGLGGESGRTLDPNAVNPMSGALGIGQWLGGRARGVAKGDLRGQVDHMISELKGPERAALNRLRGAHTIEDATRAWVEGFERPSPAEIRSSMPARLGYSREAFNRFRGQSGGGGGDTGGRGGGSGGGTGGGTGGSILDVTSRRIPGRTTALAGRTFETTVPTLDTEGYERARKLSVVGQMIARRNPQSILLRSGLLSTSEPSISDFIGSRTTANTVPGVTVRTPGMTALSAREINLPGGGGGSGGSGGGGRGSARAAGARGSYQITGPNPNRIQPKVRGFLGELSAVAGETIVGSDGTGHSKFTVNGNVSEHFTGSATDIPAKGGHLTRLGQAALIAAGMPPSKARKVKGGLFNVNRGGHRYQIIFNTMEGGNHYDHLHVGVH